MRSILYDQQSVPCVSCRAIDLQCYMWHAARPIYCAMCGMRLTNVVICGILCDSCNILYVACCVTSIQYYMLCEHYTMLYVACCVTGVQYYMWHVV